MSNLSSVVKQLFFIHELFSNNRQTSCTTFKQGVSARGSLMWEEGGVFGDALGVFTNKNTTEDNQNSK